MVMKEMTIVASASAYTSSGKNDADIGALTLERGVPVVLDGVVGSAVEEAGDGGPLVAEAGVGPDYGVVFLWREGTVLHLRGELVAPPEPARLAGPTGYRLADQRPVTRTVLLYQPLQSVVLFGAPWTLYPIHIFSAHCHHKCKSISYLSLSPSPSLNLFLSNFEFEVTKIERSFGFGVEGRKSSKQYLSRLRTLLADSDTHTHQPRHKA